MNPYEPQVVAAYGGWELIEGLTGRALRRRCRGPAKPHLIMGTAAVVFGAWMFMSGELPERPAMVVVGFGLLVILLGTRLSKHASKELRLGSTELMWAGRDEV